MAFPRTAASALMSKGLLTAGWNSVLTGLAMLCVAYLLASGPADHDSAAPVVAVVMAVAGVWQLECGLRAEFRRRHESTTSRVH